MTIEEKRKAIKNYCGSTWCDECKLRDTKHCYSGADDSEIEENYNILFGEPEAERR